MADEYGYGNARIRAMKAALLDRRAYEALLWAAGVEALIEALARTDYKTEIEAALVKHGGLRCVTEGLSRNVARTIGSISRFFDGRPLALVRLLVSRWDIGNLIAILRGQARGVGAEQVVRALVPAGELKEAELKELVEQPTMGATAALMLTWRLPYAAALAGALRRADGDLPAIEAELHKSRFREAVAALGDQEDDRLVRAMLESEIDIVNLSLLLRLATLGDRPAALRARFGTAESGRLLIDGGSLAPGLLAALAAAPDVEAMAGLLGATPYGRSLQGRLEAYRRSGDVAILERGLEEVLVLKGFGMFHRDPLGIGTAIGYVWAKSNEVANLRLIAHGKALGWQPEAIREEMIWWAGE